MYVCTISEADFMLKVMLIRGFCDTLGVKQYPRYRRCAKKTIVIVWCFPSHLSFFLSICPLLPDFTLELPEDSQLFFLLLLELCGLFCFLLFWGVFWVCLAKCNIVSLWMLTRWVALNKPCLAVIYNCSKMWASVNNKQFFLKKEKNYNPWSF